jgi:hypothetical protein
MRGEIAEPAVFISLDSDYRIDIPCHMLTMVSTNCGRSAFDTQVRLDCVFGTGFVRNGNRIGKRYSRAIGSNNISSFPEPDLDKAAARRTLRVG